MKRETDAERRQRIRAFLTGCSGQELTDFLLVKHASAANFRNKLFELIDKWVEDAADARLAAEVNVMREERKHSLTIPFPEKVKETPPHPEAPPAGPTFNHGDHGGADLDAVGAKYPRQFFKR